MDTSLAQALGEIQKTLGNIDGKLDSHLKAFEKHVASDEAMAADIKALQLAGAKQKGFITAVQSLGTIIGSIVGAALGIIGDRWLMRGH